MNIYRERKRETKRFKKRERKGGTPLKLNSRDLVEIADNSENGNNVIILKIS